MSEHQTPRTSAASFDIIWRNGAYHVTRADVGNMAVVSADLAEKLERESADRLALLLAAELREKALRNAMDKLPFILASCAQVLAEGTIRAAYIAQFGEHDWVVCSGAVEAAYKEVGAALAEPASPSPELAAMMADKLRLDWLEKIATDFEFHFMVDGLSARNYATGCVVRAVIDAARKCTPDAKP